MARAATGADRRDDAPPPTGRPSASARRAAAALAALGLLALAPLARGAEEGGGPVLELETITYVASRAGERTMVLDAAQARFRPDERVVHLQDVRAHIAAAARTEGLDLTCERGTFDLATRGFVAEGNVRGTTGDGRRFRTARLHYEDEARLVASDAPVEIRDATGTYRGGGFRYHVDEARFRLLGGATVVQEP